MNLSILPRRAVNRRPDLAVAALAGVALGAHLHAFLVSLDAVLRAVLR